MLRFVSVRWKIAVLLFAVVIGITGLDAWLDDWTVASARALVTVPVRPWL